jgi:hypothetical protein
MQAIHLFFNPNRAIYYNSKTKGYLVRMSSREDLQKVINFFSFENHYDLTGFKKKQYLDWLNLLKKSDRYKNLNFPD